MAYKRHIIVLGLYIAVSLLMSLPLLAQLGTYVIGEGGDVWQTMWRFEHKQELVGQAISEGNLSGFLTEEFFGGGEARLVNLSVWPWMILHALFGQPLAYNLTWLIVFVLSGYGMYLLVRYLLARYVVADERGQALELEVPWIAEAAPFLAGMLYTLLAYRTAHSFGHFGAMQLQWLPFLILLTMSFFERPNVWKTFGLGVLFAVQAWTEHHYALWFVLFAAIYKVFFWDRIKTTAKEKKGIPYGVLLGFLFLFFTILPYVPTIELGLMSDSPLSLGVKQTERFSADLFSFITPPSWHPVWGSVFYNLFGKYFSGNVFEATQYLGLVPLLLVLFFHQRIPGRQKLFWLIVAGFFGLVALGPTLHVFGKQFIPLPYAIIDSWPVFSSVRTVARAGVMVGLSFAVLFGWVLGTQLRRIVNAGLVVIVLVLEFLFMPVPLQSTELSSVYKEVAGLEGSTVVEIPAATNYRAASKALYASRIHGKEVIGNIALERAQEPEDFQEAKSLPGLRQILYLRTGHLLEDRQEFFDQHLSETLPDVFDWIDASGAIVHADSLTDVQMEAIVEILEGELGLSPESFDDALLYRFDNANFELTDGVFLSRDGRFENVGYDPERDSTFAEVSSEATVSLYNVKDNPLLVELSFLIPEESGGAAFLRKGDERIAEVIKGSGRARIQLSIDPGKTDIDFVNQLTETFIIQDPLLTVVQ